MIMPTVEKVCRTDTGLAASLRVSIARLHRRLRTEYADDLRMSPGGIAVLAVLSREGDRTVGQLAAALSVAPGTATTMVKTLAESGLVRYEPYSGVALTPAGQRLAGLVLRRHRLIELFLVRVMGYSWDEVHDEAEHLEQIGRAHV